MLQERPATVHPYPPHASQPAAARPNSRQNRQLPAIPADPPFQSQPAARPNNRRHHQPTATHPQTTSTQISRKLSSSLVKRSCERTCANVAPPIPKIPNNPANPASDNHRLRVELLAAVDTWSRLFKMGHMQDACGQHWPVSRLMLLFYHHNLPWQRCSPCPSAALRGQKGVKVFSAPLRGPPRTKRC